MQEKSGATVELRGLSRSFSEGDRERVVLQGVDATFEEGEFIVLLGRSGSGKSTLLNLIAGLEKPNSGSVCIDGRVITDFSEHESTIFRRHHVGFIFQSYNLIPTLTVGENVLLPMALQGREAEADHARAVELLERVGLADRYKSFPDILSGGEQQRLALARALVHDPPLILADEPTGNLDLDTGRDVLDLLQTLVRERGKTLVMVTHSREVMGHASRTFWLKAGRLEEHQADEPIPGPDD